MTEWRESASSGGWSKWLWCGDLSVHRVHQAAEGDTEKYVGTFFNTEAKNPYAIPDTPVVDKSTNL